MMDFGFGSFLDKFEARFGRRLMTWMLVLVGLTVTSFCLNLIATYAIIPTIGLIYTIVATDTFGSYQMLKTIQVLLNIFFFLLLYLGFRAALDTHRERAEAIRITDEYKIFRDFAMEFWSHTGEFHTRLSEAFNDLEAAKTKTQRDVAITQIRVLIDASRADYAEKVSKFNEVASPIRDRLSTTADG